MVSSMGRDRFTVTSFDDGRARWSVLVDDRTPTPPHRSGRLDTVAVGVAGGALGGAALGLWIVGDGTNSSIAVVRAAIGGAVGGGFAGTRIRETRQAVVRSDRDRQRWKSLFAKTPTAVADLSICENDFSIVAVNDEFRNSVGAYATRHSTSCETTAVVKRFLYE